jgi:hypothetical protein
LVVERWGALPLVVLRDRVLEPVRPDLPDEDVLLLRDPDGEDVRVAMPPT